jgi:hypothetical protein
MQLPHCFACGANDMKGSMKMRTALTIAGSDCSGGAGIQADIKTMTANGVYAMSAITALTAQNTTGVYGVLESTDAFLANQLDCIFSDIFPDAVKTGMVSSCALIEVIAEKLRRYGAKNIVVDPVMVATSGSRLIAQEAVETLKARLLRWRMWLRQIFRSTGSLRDGNRLRFADGSGGVRHWRKIWLCGFGKRRSSCAGCGRFALAGRSAYLVSRQPN